MNNLNVSCELSTTIKYRNSKCLILFFIFFCLMIFNNIYKKYRKILTILMYCLLN